METLEEMQQMDGTQGREDGLLYDAKQRLILTKYDVEETVTFSRMSARQEKKWRASLIPIYHVWTWSLQPNRWGKALYRIDEHYFSTDTNEEI